MESENCRLCQGPTVYSFSLPILEKYPTDYFECRLCGCLQTASPHWLNEAYAIKGVHIDVGQAARVIQTWLRLCFLLGNIGFDCSSNCVDYGGSAGLLTRLMRDSGYNYFAYDLYDDSKYANYFQIESFNDFKPSLISAFEVFEHLPEPQVTLTSLLESRPELLIFTTQFYERQGPGWPYLVPFCGQHVFFYSQSALRQFANLFDYELRDLQGFWGFVRRQGSYASEIDRALTRSMETNFAGEQVMRLGWGTDATVRDSAYAFDRFKSELKRDR